MNERHHGIVRRATEILVSLVIAGALTLAIFLILPLLQTISARKDAALVVQSLDVVDLPPPPEAPPPEVEPEEAPDEPAPELEPQVDPLSLDQLELALSPSVGESVLGDFAVRLADVVAGGASAESAEGGASVFSIADLDQRPRAVFQRAPTYPPELRRSKREGRVYVTFLVDTQGRVQSPRVHSSSDPAFEPPALEAVKQWRFEPGTRQGERVSFKMRVPITFQAG